MLRRNYSDGEYSCEAKLIVLLVLRSRIEGKLSRVRIIDDIDIPKDEVLIGATVKLKDLDTGEELEYALVSELEADYSQGKISVTSPVGAGLLGHKENEVVGIKIPAGLLRYKILKISR